MIITHSNISELDEAMREVTILEAHLRESMERLARLMTKHGLKPSLRYRPQASRNASHGLDAIAEMATGGPPTGEDV